MPRTRFRVPDMGGYQPAVEGRQEDKTIMITGRNFAFDSKGPRSLFGTRLLAQGQVIEVEGGVAQNVLVGNKNFVFTTQGCWVLAKDKQSWIKIYDLSNLFDIVNNKAELKWTGAYLSDGIYLCHPKYGFFKAGQNVLLPKDSEDIPGLNERPIAVAETNGRLIVLGGKYVSWSAPSAAENFTPELGGAGQQLLSDRVSGTPKHLAAFQQGFLVWTDQDCMLAEFIGGDNVFRFTRVATKQIPLGAFAVEDMPDGSQLICTKQGLHRIANGNEPELVAPIFNEFFREVLKHESGITVRLTYHMEADHLYVQLRDWTNHYVRTYVLSLALDKWGIFSDRHLGAIQYASTRGAFGYVDSQGTGHKFVDHTFNREVTPHVFEGLDSSIEFGYIRPPEMFELGDIDTLLEMQEIFLGGYPVRPSTNPQDVIDMGVVEANQPEITWMVYADFTAASEEYLINNVPVTQSEMFADSINPDAQTADGIEFPGPTEPDNAPAFTAAARAALLAGAQAGLGYTMFVEFDWDGYIPSGEFQSGYIAVLGNTVDLTDYYLYWGITSGQALEDVSWAGNPRTEHEAFLNTRLGVADQGWLGDDGPLWLNNGVIRIVNAVYSLESPGVYANLYSVNGGFNTGFYNGPIDESLAIYLDAVAIGIIGNNTVWGGMLSNAKLRRIGFSTGLTTQLEVDVLAAATLPLTIEIHPNSNGIFKVEGQPYSMSNRETPVGARNRFPHEITALGKIGLTYRGFKIQAFGGKPPYTYAVVNGALPDGLTLDAEGNVGGVPEQNGSFSFAIRVTDSLGAIATTAEKTIRIQKAVWILMDERCHNGGAPLNITNVNIGEPHPTRKILVSYRAQQGHHVSDVVEPLRIMQSPGVSEINFTHVMSPAYVPDPDAVRGENTFWIADYPDFTTARIFAGTNHPNRIQTYVSVFALYDVDVVLADSSIFGYVLASPFTPEDPVTLFNDVITIPAGGFAIGAMNTHMISGVYEEDGFVPDVLRWTGLNEQSEFCWSVGGSGAFTDVTCSTVAALDSVAGVVDQPYSVEVRVDLVPGAVPFYNEIASVVVISFAPAA